MKFEEAYARTRARLLSQAEVAEEMGTSERTFQRWADRFNAEGGKGSMTAVWAGLGAAGAGGRGGAGVRVVRHPLPGLHRQALPRVADGRAWLQAQLQLGAPDLAGTRAHAPGAQARRTPISRRKRSLRSRSSSASQTARRRRQRSSCEPCFGPWISSQTQTLSSPVGTFACGPLTFCVTPWGQSQAPNSGQGGPSR